MAEFPRLLAGVVADNDHPQWPFTLSRGPVKAFLVSHWELERRYSGLMSSSIRKLGQLLIISLFTKRCRHRNNPDQHVDIAECAVYSQARHFTCGLLTVHGLLPALL